MGWTVSAERVLCIMCSGVTVRRGEGQEAADQRRPARDPGAAALAPAGGPEARLLSRRRRTSFCFSGARFSVCSLLPAGFNDRVTRQLVMKPSFT